jgi:pimeloyl-ACP methyl ester carboxylesterase
MAQIRGMLRCGVTLLSVLVSGVFTATVSGAVQTAAGKDAAGVWLGTLKVPGVELRIGFVIQRNPDGALAGTLNSIDQGAMNIPLDGVAFRGDSLICFVKAIQGGYEGKIAEDGKTVEGKWKQGGGVFPLTLDRVDKLPVFNRPQNPLKPYPYKAEEVRYENKAAAVTLAGTLTLPEAKGPFPAVILLTGSGPQNRDEELFQHKPFLVLSDYLTRRGIAVLRADDRGVGQSTGDFAKSTTGDFADDALAGIEYLKTRGDINSRCIGLVGHSEGGMIAPIAAVKSPDVAFIVMLAGPGLPFGDIVIGQILQMLEKRGMPKESLPAVRDWYLRMYAAVAKPTDNAAAEKELRDLYAEMDEKTRQKINWPPERFEGSFRDMLNPWWRYAVAYSPKGTLMKVECPVLALNGEKDTQVPAGENLKAIEEALKAGKNKHFIVKEMPGLNHMFQTAQTGDEAEYVKIEETMSPSAMQTVADWILERKGVR